MKNNDEDLVSTASITVFPLGSMHLSMISFPFPSHNSNYKNWVEEKDAMEEIMKEPPEKLEGNRREIGGGGGGRWRAISQEARKEKVEQRTEVT